MEDLETYQRPNAWDRQEGESNLWYDRFHRFLMCGSNRTINQIYRDVINEKRAAKGRERLRKAAPAASSWRKKALEFNWWGRAEAWDNHRRVQAMQTVSDSLDLVRYAAQEAVQFQIDMMRGKILLEIEDGNKIILQLGPDDIQQMRLASNSILNRAGVVYDGPKSSEEDGEVEIIGIKIMDSE